MNKISILLVVISFWVFIVACSAPESAPTSMPVEATETLLLSSPHPTALPAPTSTIQKDTPAAHTEVPTISGPKSPLADVLTVSVNGSQNAYQFAVEISSPDTGCEQYADWWEVITLEGDLIYRRILAHSHVNEQPFTRSGGPLAISSNTVVIVRAHLHPRGYGGTAFQGSVEDGFTAIDLNPGFAPDLENLDPLPAGCGF